MNTLQFIENMKKTPEKSSTVNLLDIFKIKKKNIYFK